MFAHLWATHEDIALCIRWGRLDGDCCFPKCGDLGRLPWWFRRRNFDGKKSAHQMVGGERGEMEGGAAGPGQFLAGRHGQARLPDGADEGSGALGHRHRQGQRERGVAQEGGRWRAGGERAEKPLCTPAQSRDSHAGSRRKTRVGFLRHGQSRVPRCSGQPEMGARPREGIRRVRHHLRHGLLATLVERQTLYCMHDQGRVVRGGAEFGGREDILEKGPSAAGQGRWARRVFHACHLARQGARGTARGRFGSH